MIVVPAWHRRAVEEVLARAQNAQVTYLEQGGTRSAVLPDGYHHDRYELHLGQGKGCGEAAREALRRWAAHRSAGFVVTPRMAALEPGVTVVASRAVGPVIVAIPCRIVYRTDEPDRFGFAYGTLPGHPEQGEEAFHVLKRPDGSVTAQIVAFSRPADWPTRVAGPLARRVQSAASSRYLRGIAAFVAAT